MEFATRPCRPGDEEALSFVAQGTILETYGGISEGHDLVTYAASELSPSDFNRMLSENRIRAWIAETIVGSVPSDMPWQFLMKV